MGNAETRAKGRVDMRRRTLPLVSIVCTLVVSAASHAQDLGRIPTDLPRGVEVTRDLAYAKYGDRILLLDLYRPAERGDTPLPVVVAIRGGGWKRGDKEGFGPMAAALAKRGLAAVSIEYRASGEALFPAAVQDVKAAIRWVRADADAHGLDPGAVGAIGGSAGAHLAVYASLTHDDPQFEGEGGHPEMSSALSAVVGMATPADFEEIGVRGASDAVPSFLGVTIKDGPELWRRASPVRHVESSSPPALLIHSEADTVVPFGHSVRLAQRYGEAGVAVELVLIPEAPHAFWNLTGWFDDTMDRAAAFFARYLAQPDP